MDDSLRVWRSHVGGVAWPTLLLFAVAFAVWCAAVSLHYSGLLSTGVAMMMTGLSAYVLFTPLHEAAHGNVGGKGRGWVDAVVGWASAAVLLGAFPAFRIEHLRHHTHTNHPDKDPDMWVAGSPWTVPLRCLSIMPHYYMDFAKLALEGGPARRVFPAVLMGVALQSVALVAALLAGAGWTVGMVVVLPAVLAHGVLAWSFDYLPHHPHEEQGRYIDTVARPSWWLEWVLLGQNLHLVHHLWPSVPFYRYGAVFAACREAVVERGARVMPVGLTAPPRGDRGAAVG